MITRRLRSLVPSSWSSSSQTNTPQAGSSSRCHITYTQDSTANVWTPSHYSPRNAPMGMGPRPQTVGIPFASSGMLTHVNHPPSLFPSPKTTVPLPFPCTLFPPDPHHEWHFLILSRGLHFPAVSCYVCVKTLAFFVHNEFVLLSS